MSLKNKTRIKLFLVVVLAIFAGLVANPKPTGVGWLDSASDKLKINLGLDLQGGAHLVYEADVSRVEQGKEGEALDGIQDVIKKRIDAYGVSEPVVQTSKVGGSHRLIVELPGVDDIQEAKNMIDKTPILEFKERNDEAELSEEEKEQISQQRTEAEKEASELFEKVKAGEDFAELAKEHSEDPGSAQKGGDLGFIKKGDMLESFEEAVFSEELEKGEVYPELVESSFGYHIIKKTDEKEENGERMVKASHILFRAPNQEQILQQKKAQFIRTGLTGQHLKESSVRFNQQTGRPEVGLKFNDEGKELFKEITERNQDKQVAIFLDGSIISAPTVQAVIRNGEAVINGQFTLEEAKQLAQRLNAGALPVPIKLVSQQSVGPTLGKISLEKSLIAGLYGLIAVGVFMILYYRLLGVISVVALVIYTALMVSIFKLSSLTPMAITLTLSGIAGFILSVGMAVDANILIFERVKEEIRKGKSLRVSAEEGFKRAWSSIRDGNTSTILTAVILMIMGTGFIKGFAITLMIGILFSMFTAIVVTRLILQFILVERMEKYKWLFVPGARKKEQKTTEEK
ncbi:MAG: protein translocase subunit SecD [Candidatus Moranbacteria bacterium]|nr:protein translocase subunit SecD [Candidatus Moranbacteria bacterium]